MFTYYSFTNHFMNLEKIKDVVAKGVVWLLVITILWPVVITPLVFIGYHLYHYQETIKILSEIYRVVMNNLPQVWIFLLVVSIAWAFMYGTVKTIDWAFWRVIKDEVDETMDWPKTFWEYVDVLQKFLEKHPELGDKKVIYSKDSEWNSFHEIYYTPSFWTYDEKEQWFDSHSENSKGESVNAVCIN